ncbi:hypothetical protein H0H93_010249, partial [Arthromyces matolae]
AVQVVGPTVMNGRNETGGPRGRTALKPCLSCRLDKVRCRPPPLGSDDPSCNRCKTEGRKCEYDGDKVELSRGPHDSTKTSHSQSSESAALANRSVDRVTSNPEPASENPASYRSRGPPAPPAPPSSTPPLRKLIRYLRGSGNSPQLEDRDFPASSSQKAENPQQPATSGNNITQSDRRVYGSALDRSARTRSEEQVATYTSLIAVSPRERMLRQPNQRSPSSGPSNDVYRRRPTLHISPPESDYSSDRDDSSSTHRSNTPQSLRHMKPTSWSTNIAQNAHTSTSHEDLGRRLGEIFDRRTQRKRSPANDSIQLGPSPTEIVWEQTHRPFLETQESSSMDNRRRGEELQWREQEVLRKERRIALKEQDLEQRETAVKEVERLIQERFEELQRWRLRRKRIETTALLRVIFRDVESYKRLLSSNKEDAQKVLDAFQLLLDTESFKDRTQLIAAMRRISERTELYPSRFFLEDAVLSSDDEPVISGGFSDVYKIIFRGEEMCFKVIRVYQRSKVEHMAKVYAREAILWAQLSHPNILPFFGLAKFRSRLSFVTRWAQNGSLPEYLVHNPKAIRILL